MSFSSLAISRRNASKELNELAEQHIQHDLAPSDRDALKRSAEKFSFYTTVGSLAGLGLGIALAVRVRRLRASTFKAFRAVERPTHVQFADGRTEALPDLSPLLKPSTAGDVAAYVFFSFGGLFIGGETGLLAGSYAAKKTLMQDPQSQARIDNAFRKFKADILRKELADLEKGDSAVGADGNASAAGGIGDIWST